MSLRQLEVVDFENPRRAFVTPNVTPEPIGLILKAGSEAYLFVLFGVFGSGGRDRTYDQLINSQLLYR